MDTIAEGIAEYVKSLRYEDIGDKTTHEAKRRIIDTLGCAMGAFNAEPVKSVRDWAKNTASKKPATILGTKFKTSVEAAAFANTTMSRYLDFMDTYFHNGEIVHPEDNIASILSVAESEKSSGKEILLSTVLSYEICCRMVDFANIRKRGWDHVIWITMSSAGASGRLMKLSREEIVHALSVGISSNIPLRQIRIGHLSMWKGLAAPYSAMAGVLSTNLARGGITGPTEIFEGQHGFFNQVSGVSNLHVKNFAKGGNGFKILDTHIKKYPAEINSQSAIDAAMSVRDRIKNIRDIEEVNIRTFTTGYEIIADASKWNPTNRETADHSLPYIVCAAIVDGEITEKQFSERKIFDPTIRSVLKKTKVSPSEECDKDYGPGMPNIVEVKMKGGEKYSSKVVNHRGSSKNPMTDDELEEKFRDLTKKYLSENQIRGVLDFVWKLDKQKDISKLFSSIIVKK